MLLLTFLYKSRKRKSERGNTWMTSLFNICHTDMCRQFICPISLMCLIFFAKNVGNNIKREEPYSSEACTCDEVMSFLFSCFFHVLCYFHILKTYKTHKRYRTHLVILALNWHDLTIIHGDFKEFGDT